MPDLMTRLAALHVDTTDVVGDDTVAADARRGRTALLARRKRRFAVAGTTLGIAAVGSLSYAATTGGNSPAPRAVVSQPAVNPTPTTHSVLPTRASTTPRTSHTSVPALELVAYRGDQLPGYTVTRIPAGYVLQGISGSVLDVARAGDHSSLDTFIGKIVVMLNDHPGATDGTRESVKGHPANLSVEDGVQMLTYKDGARNVEVQAWSDVKITPEQLVAFAEGVTVLPNAQEGHG